MWLAFVLPTASAAPPFTASEACDVPTPPIASQPASDADACEQACRERTDCGAWTFVSGWGQCRLHAPTDRRVGVHLVAGTLVGVERTPGPTLRDHDHPGRDLEPAPRDLPSADACAAACVGTAACVGFVYVEGYRSCWLKRTEGLPAPKTFTCARRTPSPG